MGRAARPAAALLPLLLLLLRAERPRGAELTFELPDNARQCFHEDVEQGVRLSLDYQVRRDGASVGGRQVPAAFGGARARSRLPCARHRPVRLESVCVRVNAGGLSRVAESWRLSGPEA